jgi:4-hydroxybenzoate polyprenyltransferase
MRITEYLRLIRIQQWYKNLVIFLPLFFVGELLKVAILGQVLIGFVALCLVSSSNYIINDIIDAKKDRLHPEKKYRPIASGKVSMWEGGILAFITLALALLIAYPYGIFFLSCVIFLFILTFLYSIYLKNEPVLDVIIIAMNFVVRAVSGAFIIHVIVSPWLILCPFFLALFLAVGKRDADLKVLRSNASKHKEVLKFYDPKTTNGLMIISTTCLIIAYSLYAFSRTELLLLTLPFAIYTIYRYYSLVNSGSKIARHPELAYKDWRIVIAILLWAIMIFVIFYCLIGRVSII